MIFRHDGAKGSAARIDDRALDGDEAERRRAH